MKQSTLLNLWLKKISQPTEVVNVGCSTVIENSHSTRICVKDVDTIARCNVLCILNWHSVPCIVEELTLKQSLLSVDNSPHVLFDTMRYTFCSTKCLLLLLWTDRCAMNTLWEWNLKHLDTTCINLANYFHMYIFRVHRQYKCFTVVMNGSKKYEIY